MAGKALIAMSGGVDSSVAAWLMKQAGWDCIGVTMKLYDNEDIGMEREKTCCSLSDIEDARSVAYKIGIPYYVFNFKEDFREKVIDPFIRSYQCGMTPNPCIECNRHLKFEHLYRRAEALGCDVIVTGHYARITKDEEGYHLLKGLDGKKDQSYVLYSLTQDQLAHTCFPLGDYSKEEIRHIAQEQGFYNAAKRDSQDICFIPDGDYRSFIEETTGHKNVPGDFVDKEGNVIGPHKGYVCYTIGQRRGLGISAPSPYYVIDIIPDQNKVVLGSNEDLFRTDLIADDFNWIEDVEADELIKARIRYHQAEKEANVKKLEDGRVAVHFLEPQRAITRGQAVVIYRGDHVAGGGTIVERL
ncbi:MAG: tRNA 2-thiouridine(34) synthase MnmA [Eubacterium sp.]|nr:tRNA 2-thiouridine(34) synthase MnmA [Eubacterium sp.]